jgi:hypothetical protein
MAQSYVSKPLASKGIGRVIRRFVVSPFNRCSREHQLRASAQFD